MTKKVTYISSLTLESRVKHDIVQVEKIKSSFSASRSSAENVATVRTVAGNAIAASTSSMLGGLPLVKGGVEGLRGWNAASAQTEMNGKIARAETHSKRGLLTVLGQHRSSLGECKNFNEVKSVIGYQAFLSNLQDSAGLPAHMSETVNNFYQRSLSDLIVIGVNGTQLNHAAINDLAEVVNTAGQVMSADVRAGFEASHRRDVDLALVLGKAAKLTQADLDKIKNGQVSILAGSEKLKAHVKEVKATCKDYFEAQEARQAEADDRAQRRADRQSAMNAISLVGDFGQMIGSPELVMTAQIASTTMEVVDAFQSAIANTLSGFLNPMVAAGQGVLTLIQLFSGPKPDPVMEQLKVLSKKLDALRDEVRKGFDGLEEGQQQIFERMCRSFVEVVSMVSGSEQRISDLIRVRLDRLSSNMHFLHEMTGAQLNDLLMRELETLSTSYGAGNLRNRLAEKSIDQLTQNLERLHSWAVVQSTKPIHNGLKMAQPELNVETYPADRFIHAVKHMKPLDMLAFLVGYIKTKTTLSYGDEGIHKQLPNYSVWLTAIISISKLLTHCPEEFLAKNKATIKTCLDDVIRVGVSLKAGLTALNSNQLITTLITKYSGELAHARQLFSGLVSASNQGQVLTLTDSIDEKISALSEMPVAVSYAGNLLLPGVFRWASLLGYGDMSVSDPEGLTKGRERHRHNNRNESLTWFNDDMGHAHYHLDIQTNYAVTIRFADRNGVTHTLSDQKFNRQIRTRDVSNENGAAKKLIDLTDNGLLTSSSATTSQMPEQRFDVAITNVVNGIKQSALTTQNRLKNNLASAVVEGTGAGADIHASLERLEATRLCLYALLEINDQLPENTSSAQFLLSRDKITSPFSAVIAAQGASTFPAQLGGSFDQSEINTLSSSFEGVDNNDTSSSLATLSSLLDQLEITRDYVTDTVNAIPQNTLAEYRDTQSSSATRQALRDLTGQMQFMARLMQNTFAQMRPDAAQAILAKTMAGMQQGNANRDNLSGAMFGLFSSSPASSSGLRSGDEEQVITPLESPENT